MLDFTFVFPLPQYFYLLNLLSGERPHARVRVLVPAQHYTFAAEIRSDGCNIGDLPGLVPLHSQQSMNFKIPTPLVLPDRCGQFTTVSKTGSIDLGNPFFKTLGTNGRTCASCHTPTDGWSVTPRSLVLRFLLTGGRDPIFRPVEGANCPNANASTLAARASAYSLLLKKGLIRIFLPTPQNGEFTISQIQDPYACSVTTPSALSLYRRPMPSTNLTFLSDVMWDGRNSRAARL